MHTTSTTKSEANTRLAELDSLRGIAAISVLLFHFTMNANSQKLGWEFKYGVTGVDIFFMISGFVIFLSITKIAKWQDFVVARFARLYPAFWFCLTITIIFTLIFDPENINTPAILGNATMIPNYFSIEDLDGSYWTLSIELIFYLWILILYILKKIDHVARIGFFTTVSIIVFHKFDLLYPDFYMAITRKVQLLNHFSLFYSGILFYQLRSNQNSPKTIILILFSLLTSCYLHNKGGRSQYVISPATHYVLITSFHLIFALFVKGKLAFLKFRPLLFLGKISYCLYLIHQYVGISLIAKLTNDFQVNVYAAILLVIPICISIAYLANRFVEIPCNHIIKNWYNKNNT